jgi:acyl-CoA synthetase (AMP-forming)/AMP-acid ligase II
MTQDTLDTSTSRLPPVKHILSVIEDRAANNYTATSFACLPKTTDPRDGFYDITYRILKRAIDRMSWAIEERLGKVSEENQVFGFIGPPTDWRYILLAFAAMKTGHTVFLPSPRNSLEAHLSLLDNSECTAILHPTDPPHIVNILAEHRALQLASLPSLSYFLDPNEEDVEYPFTASLEELYQKPCMVLHTSGSTGIPKPILLKHAWFTSVDAIRHLPKLGAFDWGLTKLHHRRAFVPFPNFHGASITTNTLAAVYLELTTIHAHPDTPCTAELADLYHTHANVEASFLPVSILKDISKDKSMIAHLESLQAVFYGGSPLSPDIGDILSQHVHLISLLGITEVIKQTKTLHSTCQADHYRSPGIFHSKRPIQKIGNTCTSVLILVSNFDLWGKKMTDTKWSSFVSQSYLRSKWYLLPSPNLKNGRPKTYTRNILSNRIIGIMKEEQMMLSSSAMAKSSTHYLSSKLSKVFLR